MFFERLILRVIKKKTTYEKERLFAIFKRKSWKPKTRVLLKKTLIVKMVLRVGEGKKNFEYKKRFIGRKSLTRKEGKCLKETRKEEFASQ